MANGVILHQTGLECGRDALVDGGYEDGFWCSVGSNRSGFREEHLETGGVCHQGLGRRDSIAYHSQSSSFSRKSTGRIHEQNHTHPLEYYGLQFDTPIDHGTTHLSIVDSNGGAASVTSTVNLIWGSHVMDPSTGVIFNDEQDDFSVPGAADAFGLWPSPWNYPAPGKRPLSSTSANIIETTSSDLSHKSGELWAVLGGSGGSRIFPSIAQILIQLIHCHREISTAIELPRYHDQIYPPGVSVEVGPDGEDAEVVGGLEARGHKVQLFDINLGVAEVQGVVLQGGKVWAASDSRKNGIAAAY